MSSTGVMTTGSWAALHSVRYPCQTNMRNYQSFVRCPGFSVVFSPLRQVLHALFDICNAEANAKETIN